MDLQSTSNADHEMSETYKRYRENKYQLEGMVLARYRVYGKLGGGQFGSVYQAIDIKKNRLVALKLIDKNRLFLRYKSEAEREKLRKYFETEIQIMRQFNHQNIVTLYEAYRSEDMIIMAMQHCRKGTLGNQIQKTGGFDEGHAINVINQVLLAVAEMHKNKVIHRDLKADNILISNGIYFVADFGLAKLFDPQEKKLTNCGSPETKAPEVQTKLYNHKVDIWSLGVIFLQMLIPGSDSERRYSQLLRRIESKNFDFKLKSSERISQISKDFLNKTLVDQKQRIDWEQLVKHPILSYRSKQISQIFDISVSFSHLDPNAINSSISDLHHMPADNLIEGIHQSEDHVKVSECLQQPEQLNEKIIKISAPITYRQNEAYDFLCRLHLGCKLAEYIFCNYIRPIEQWNLLDLKRSKTIELMFLLSSRCFFYMSAITNKQKQNRIPREHYSQQLDNFVTKQVGELYSKIKWKFQSYSDSLTKTEGSFFQTLKKLIGGKNQRPMFQGIETLDYQFEDHVQLSQQYLNDSIGQLRKVREDVDRDILANFRVYSLINRLELKHLETNTFNEQIKHILHKEKIIE